MDWHQLRPLKGSKEDAFEELCCQIYRCESPRKGSIFHRKGNPDAGLEGFWLLPDGSEHGLQAKFFLTSPSSAQWSQIDRSVMKALRLHPSLTKLVIWLPIDRPDGRVEGEKSMFDKWTERVSSWNGIASNMGMSVEFKYRGQHEMLDKLRLDEHQGRRRYWFNETEMSKDWFKERADESIAALNKRYFPEAHVSLNEVEELFEGLGATRGFFTRLQPRRETLDRTIQKLMRSCDGTEIGQQVHKVVTVLKEIAVLLEQILCNMQSSTPIVDHFLHAESLPEVLTRFYDAFDSAHHAIHKRISSLTGDSETKQERETLRSIQHEISGIRSDVYSVQVALTGDAAKAGHKRGLILVGEAGHGKSHLFARITEQRIAGGLPTILVVGGQLDLSRPLYKQITECLDVDASFDEILGELSAAAETCGSRAILLIDALNESNHRVGWQSSLPQLLSKVRRFPWVTLAVSIRSCYLENVLGSDFEYNNWELCHHSGFAGHEPEAAESYFKHFQISPNVPLLDPVFSNGLFLRIYCEVLHRLGQTDRHFGFHEVFDDFLGDIQKRLTQTLDVDPDERVVEKAIYRFAANLAENVSTSCPRDEVKLLFESILPNREWTNSLMYHLLVEDIITEDLIWDGETMVDAIRFSFDRFGDFAVASSIIAQIGQSDIEKVFHESGPIGKKLKHWNSSGIVDGLSMALPESGLGELLDVAPQLLHRSIGLKSFLRTLIWRETASVDDRTVEIVSKCLSSKELRNKAFDALLTIAPVPNHPLNAEFLDSFLRGYCMPDRDEIWSTYLHIDWNTHSPINRLIGWANSKSARQAKDDVRQLVGTTLGWALSTPNRFIRDKATKGHVALFDNRPDELLAQLHQFRQIDDPYILERITASVCGVGLRLNNAEDIGRLAIEIYHSFFAHNNPPAHVLTRDYARLIIERAIELGCEMAIDSSKIHPPYQSAPLESPPPWSTIEKQMDQPGFGAIRNSLSSFGDFWRYEIGDGIGGPVKGWVHDSPDAQTHQADSVKDDEARSVFQTLLNEAYRSVFGDSSEYFQIIQSEPESEELVILNKEIDRRFGKLEESMQQRIETFLKLDEVREKDRSVADKRHEAAILDDKFIVGWLFERVKSLGWTPERFADFDSRYLSYIEDNDFRTARKPERVGKKYQWIALHEFLARATDHRPYRRNFYGADVIKFSGAWDAGSIRDIDPTSLGLPSNESRDTVQDSTWWIPLTKKGWNIHLSPNKWTHLAADVPDIQKCFLVSDENGVEWITFEGYVGWQSDRFREAKGHTQWRRVSGLIWGYLIPCDLQQEFFDWALKQDFWGRWMPENEFSLSGLYWRELFWSPYFRERLAEAPGRRPEKFTNSRGQEIELPCEIIHTQADFSWERGHGYDCSGETNVSFSAPGPYFIEQMNLSPGQREGEFVDSAGEVVFIDPSVEGVGPSCLLARRNFFEDFLQKKGLAVVWAVLLERTAIVSDMPGSGGMTHVNGVFKLVGGQVKGEMAPEPIEYNG